MAASTAPNAWLWKNPTFSDATLHVLPAGDAPDGSHTGAKPEPLLRLPLHCIVLGSASAGHFRPFLLRRWEEQRQQQPPLQPQPLTTGAGQVCHDNETDGEQGPSGDKPANNQQQLEEGQPNEKPWEHPAAQQASRQEDAHAPVQVVGQAAKQATGQPAGQTPEQPADQPTGRTPEHSAGQPAGQTPEHSAGQPAGQTSEQPAGQPAAEQPAAQPGEQAAGQAAGQAAEQATEQPVGQPGNPATVDRLAGGQQRESHPSSVLAAGWELELILHPGEPQTVPEAVVCHIYTGSLPDDTTTLIWMLWRADYLDLHATVKACLDQLRTLCDSGKLQLSDAVLLAQLPDLQTVGPAAAVKMELNAIATGVLSAKLSDAYLVLEDNQLLQQFVQLPFMLVKLWGRMSSLTVDSENTVAVLITAWYDHQLTSTPPATPTEQQCKELSKLLQLDQLTVPFHMQAIPHLKWYRPPTAAEGGQDLVLRLMAGLHSNSPLAHRWSEKGRKDARKTRKSDWTWELSQKELDGLWAQRSTTLGQGCHAAGLHFTQRLSIQPLPSNFYGYAYPSNQMHQLCIQPDVQWHPVLVKHGVPLHVFKPISAVPVCIQTGTGSGFKTTNGTFWSNGELQLLGAHSGSITILDDLVPSRTTTLIIKITV